MTHTLVEQLYLTRREWVRGLKDVSAEDSQHHFKPMNCISWMIGHLAWHEQMYWLQRGQGKTLVPEVERYGYGEPGSTPALDDVWDAWHTITDASNDYLETLTPDILETHFIVNGQPHPESIGTNVNHLVFHYWYHLGEAHAIRQLLGQRDLPSHPGNLTTAQYHREG